MKSPIFVAIGSLHPKDFDKLSETRTVIEVHGDPQKVVFDGETSLRDKMAIAVIQGLCANPDLSAWATKKEFKAADVRVDFSTAAYKTADAMLAERVK